MRLNTHKIPWPDLREEFDQIVEQLSAPDAVDKMQEDNLRKVADEIVSLYDGVCRRYAVDTDA
jgi:hypothetical protein